MEYFSLSFKVREHGYDLHKWSVKYLFSIGTNIVFLLHKSSESKDSNAILLYQCKKIVIEYTIENKIKNAKTPYPYLKLFFWEVIYIGFQ